MNQYTPGNYSQGGNRNYTRSYGEDRGQNGRGQQPYQNDFPNSGALFPVKQKRSNNSPDQTGDIEIGEDVLDYILREAERGTKVKLELSAWIRISRNNTSFTSLKINIPYGVRMEEQGNPTYQQRPNYQQRQPAPQYQQRQAPPPRQNVRQNYAEQSGRAPPPRDLPPLPRFGGSGQTDPEFARGDRMPDFGTYRNSDPNAPPF